MDFKTLCVHGCDKKYDGTGSINVPIFQSATFAHPGVGESTGFDYSRAQNPTREYLEETVSSLEGGADAIAFSSGMAAAAALMELFVPGDHIIAADDLYGGTHRLFSHISQKNGISFTAFNTYEQMKRSVKTDTRAIFIETPTNPMMQVIDIREVSEFAKEQGLLLIVDNTFLTPYFQQPLKLGADIVLHSGTKYLGGHNDTLAGFLVMQDEALSEKLRFIAKTTGACLSPFDSFMILRGIKTLSLRLECQQDSAIKITHWLMQQEAVTAVYYPGMKSHPEYEISCRQATGFGGMLSFSVKDEQTAVQVLHRVKIIKYAESLGGVESLITYPMLQTHADIPEEERLEKGIDSRLLRLSVGIEAVEDLIADLAQALHVCISGEREG